MEGVAEGDEESEDEDEEEEKSEEEENERATESPTSPPNGKTEATEKRPLKGARRKRRSRKGRGRQSTPKKAKPTLSLKSCQEVTEIMEWIEEKFPHTAALDDDEKTCLAMLLYNSGVLSHTAETCSHSDRSAVRVRVRATRTQGRIPPRR